MAQTKKVTGVATSIRTENGTTIIRYHNTDVVKFDAQAVTLNMGGWDTATTRLRMNQASYQFGLQFRVYREKGETMVHHGFSAYPLPTDRDYTFRRPGA